MRHVLALPLLALLAPLALADVAGENVVWGVVDVQELRCRGHFEIALAGVFNVNHAWSVRMVAQPSSFPTDCAEDSLTLGQYAGSWDPAHAGCLLNVDNNPLGKACFTPLAVDSGGGRYLIEFKWGPTTILSGLADLTFAP